MNVDKTKFGLANAGLLVGGSYINGQWIDAADAKNIDVLNPASGEVIAQVADLPVDNANQAIQAAKAALPAWRGKTATERSAILRRWHDLVVEHREDLARIITLEQGKTLAEARAEMGYGAKFIEWFAEEAKRVEGDVIPPPSDDKRLLVIKQPIGVVAAITPWNFPNAMITRKAAPALAAGCTFVCKPAAETPLSALALCVLAKEAGIPDGVFNVVVGDDADAIGKLFSTHPDVAKLSFTGSTRVGKLLMAQCASTCKKTSMELGGNAPFIVFDDADLDAAIEGALASKYRNSGQTCVCTNRFIVHDSVYDRFVEKLQTAVAGFKLGSGLDNDVTHGPLISTAAVRKVEALLDDAKAKGATVVCGGKPLSTSGECFYPPTVLTDVTTDMRVFREEIFGPVAPVFRFTTEDEAVAMANDTEYGLAAYFYTQNLGRVFRVSEALEYGMVGVNEGIISNEMAPFGGVKESGIGREGSKYGIQDYLEIKYICVGFDNEKI